MGEKGRALTRHHMERVKARVRRLMRAVSSWGEPTPARVAHLAETHMRPCSCVMCQRQSRRPAAGGAGAEGMGG